MCRVMNLFEYLLHAEKDVVVPEAQYFEPLCVQPSTWFIVCHVIEMLAAIEFDDEFVFETQEVGDVVANRFLSFELEFLKTTSAKVMPKSLFSFSFSSAQYTRFLTHARSRSLSLRRGWRVSAGRGEMPHSAAAHCLSVT